MKLKLSEAARTMGKTRRQVRYLIKKDRLKAHKEGGRWFVDSRDLPMTDAQRSASADRSRLVKETLEQSLDEINSVLTKTDKKFYSIRDLRAYQAGESVYRTMVQRFGGDDEGVRMFKDSLISLCYGCHSFHPEEKAAHYSAARKAAAATVIHVLLDGENEDAVRQKTASMIEQSYIPRLTSLIRTSERKSKSFRFKQFGGRRYPGS